MGANLQTKQKQKIHFVIQKQVDFGKAIYVVGNIPQLGCWNIQKSLKLSWFKDNYWTGFICFNGIQLESGIEYKYAIANWDNPHAPNIEWEAGAKNRIVDGSYCADHLICENTWNMEKITFNLIVPEDTKNQQYSVVGDCKELGSWKKSYKLKEIDRKSAQKIIEDYQVQDGKSYTVFSTSFEIFRGKPRIHYYYIKKNHGIQIQRNPGRKYELSTGFHTHTKCLKVAHPRGDTQTFQLCNFKELNYSKVTQNILLGPYVQTSEDFETLKKEGVSCILSIQTDQDLASHRLTSAYLIQQSARNNMELFTYAIQDMNKTDFVQKCKGAVQILTDLISKNKKVYVHCSAGMYRSPQIVVLFLILKENYTLEEAIQHVKNRHRFARPNGQTVKNALDYLCKNNQINILQSDS